MRSPGWSVSVVWQYQSGEPLATNFVWFQAPNLDPSSADFGKLTGTRNLPRELQLGARLTF